MVGAASPASAAGAAAAKTATTARHIQTKSVVHLMERTPFDAMEELERKPAL
jgi:hypothetical protein